jgi:hypothetical protein
MSLDEAFNFAAYGICGIAAIVSGLRGNYAFGTYALGWAILIRTTMN